jgi:tRNA threonylcarbamoyl adenosine modification protein YjeE
MYNCFAVLADNHIYDSRIYKKGIETLSIYKYTISELKSLAQDLANKAKAPLVILLNGPLGSGKTTFSQFFIAELSKDKTQKVISPTFNIIQIYETTKGEVWHIDLYRIKTEHELIHLGLFEAIPEHICLIEWPELIVPYVQNCNTVVVDLNCNAS